MAKVVLDPHGDNPVALDERARIRFNFADEGERVGAFIDVCFRNGRLLIHADGFIGGLVIYPRVTNEIEVEPGKS